MSLSDHLLPELDLETLYTRKHLERVPMDRLQFKPHPKSMPLGWLATFLAVLPTWGTFAISKDSFDVAPGGKPMPQPDLARSTAELLEMFDRNIADTRAAVAGASDEQLRKPWSLLAAGKTIFTRPRYLVFRTFFLNHMVHHRAQLGVFLRLNDIAVPAIYNDSADERGGIFMDAGNGQSRMTPPPPSPADVRR